MEEDGEYGPAFSRGVLKKKMKKCVYSVTNLLRNCGGADFNDIQPVPFARVPVVKGRYKLAQNPLSSDGSLCFDICFLNEIAVVNSTLLKEYSLLDKRVKAVMLAVKSWVKFKDIGSAANGTLSSYTWMVLVIFYLQCIGFVPCLQCPIFLKRHGIVPDPTRNRWHGIDGLNTVFVSSLMVQQRAIWETPPKFSDVPSCFLLYGFWNFYANYFPFQSTAVSIRLGKCMLQKTVFQSARLWRLCIEDPFETHDSHCPHDLGTHLSQRGQEIVMNELKDVTSLMSRMLASNTTISSCFKTYFNSKESLSHNLKSDSDLIDNGDERHADRKHQSRQKKLVPNPHEKKNQLAEGTLIVDSGHTRDRVKGKAQHQRIEVQESERKATNKPTGISVGSQQRVLTSQNEKKQNKSATGDKKGNGVKRNTRQRRRNRRASNFSESANLESTNLVTNNEERVTKSAKANTTPDQ